MAGKVVTWETANGDGAEIKLLNKCLNREETKSNVTSEWHLFPHQPRSYLPLSLHFHLSENIYFSFCRRWKGLALQHHYEIMSHNGQINLEKKAL